ncbi:angiomotin-like 2a [Thalassophryne amazonica]|uniref:angiomotin-like 2a n=1 Tax=Thalassophryne amazonica TaxID=390379 RepID=UPI001471EE11|nr:angiomotin-like 2a [Thalassophryne amazonica]XP_034036574.1 angiomotin-like 2a [Thalassophryne amazonica]
MRTAEESSGTVLHRLIQEQLRYGNLADTRALLAIQQQALRGGPGSPRCSVESLTQDESQYMHMSTRQEPQGQEHQGDCVLSESPVCQLYQFHGEELPTYEQAKAQSQYVISQKEQADRGGQTVDTLGSHSEGQWDVKREHARSLSERLMQLSLERNRPKDSLPMSSSHSYPQLHRNDITTAGVASNRQGAPHCADGPPPDYPLCTRLPGYMLSYSQEHGHYHREPPPPFYSQHHSYVSAQSHHTVIAATSELISATSSKNLLLQENERLRKELELYTDKATRLQKLELEIQRISEAYGTLMKGSAKRESLEKTMRNKLEAEIKRLHDFNRDLREQTDTVAKHRVAKNAECADQKQHVFVKLLEQNEEQQRERERLEKQVQHLRVSGEECQRRRELLEQALALAQGRNQQLEEELQRKRAYVEKVERLQGALAQLQAACEKREALELRLRTRLEQELKSLRAQQCHNQAVSSELSSTALLQQLREKEEHVLALEADITKWEQKYLEESTMRQFAMDAAATAAAQRDTTIIKHSPQQSPNSSFNDHLPLPTHRHQEMENRIRVLHAQVLEKDAVIKVLQQCSRLEQTKMEKQGLRLARSVPSINTVTSSIEVKEKNLSDDQTGAVSLTFHPHVLPKTPSRDCGTQSEAAPQEPDIPTETCKSKAPEPVAAANTDTSEEQTTPSNTFKSISCSDADVVEILI